MNWFKGSVSEAINAAKCCGGIFVVYISDKSDLSKITREKLDDKEVHKILTSSKYIAIEIENGSTDAIQFAQIYPLIIVPSLFFISPETGIPLEVIGGHVEIKALVEKLQKISSLNQPASQPETDLKNDNGDASKETLSHNPDNQSLSVDKPEKTESSPSTNADVAAEACAEPPSVTSPEVSQLPVSLDEKVQRATELLNQRTESKIQEEMEEEKRKEIERRHQLEEMTKAKKKKDEQERSELSKQRKKEKEEDRLARERVRAQIAADRAERLARISILKGEQPPSSTQEVNSSSCVAPNPSAENQIGSTVTRIKFRFPDNSSELAQFSPDATLNDIRTHLLEKSNLPFSRFKLVATLPPRSFTDDQMPITLAELDLTPSAIIIVKPIAGLSSSSVVSTGIMTIFWSLIAPLTFLINYMKGILNFGKKPNSLNDSSDEEDRQTSKRPRTEGSYTTRNRPKTAYGRRGERDAFTRREGNIHRLNRPDDDEDDENNTWNGNSTQQM